MPSAPVTVTPALSSPSPSTSPIFIPPPTAALPVMPAAAQALMPPVSSTAVSKPSPTPDSAIQTWTIDRKDKTLFRTLRRWSEEANYQLFWQIDRDFPIEVEIAFNTTFLDAVHNVMKGVAMSDYPLQASFNRNSRVLRISRHLSDNPQ
ncbi:toxin co-regulated pilus biosynthesis Q family protein [Limnohabitans sp.]|uniref:toxin co-regulated pilus biosynthesis Q family protein n=1 Tax=Limnohabitans sp. TaxID=1907725 RepID=UPI0037BF6D54